MKVEKLLLQKGAQFNSRTPSQPERTKRILGEIEKEGYSIAETRLLNSLFSNLHYFLIDELRGHDQVLPDKIAQGVQLIMSKKKGIARAELVKTTRDWHSVGLLRALASQGLEHNELFASDPLHYAWEKDRRVSSQHMNEALADPRWFAALDSLGWFSLANEQWRTVLANRLNNPPQATRTTAQTRNFEKTINLLMFASFREGDAQQLSVGECAPIVQGIGALLRTATVGNRRLSTLAQRLHRDVRWSAWLYKKVPLANVLGLALRDEHAVSGTASVWGAWAKRGIERTVHLDVVLKSLWKGACVIEPAAWLMRTIPSSRLSQKAADACLWHWTHQKDLSLSLHETQQFGVLLGRSGVEVVNQWSDWVNEALSRPWIPTTEKEKARAASATLPPGIFAWLARVQPRCVIALAHAIEEIQRTNPQEAAKLVPLIPSVAAKAWALSAYGGDSKTARPWLENVAMSHEDAQAALTNALKGIQSQNNRLAPLNGKIASIQVPLLVSETQAQWHQAERWGLQQALNADRGAGATQMPIPDGAQGSTSSALAASNPLPRRRPRML